MRVTHYQLISRTTKIEFFGQGNTLHYRLQQYWLMAYKLLFACAVTNCSAWINSHW